MAAENEHFDVRCLLNAGSDEKVGVEIASEATRIARQTLARYLLEVELDGVPWRNDMEPDVIQMASRF